jgi:hypothetical protein
VLMVKRVWNHKDTKAVRLLMKPNAYSRAALPLCLCVFVVPNVCKRSNR